MKKIAFTLTLVLYFFSVLLLAQTSITEQTLPVDSKVRIGKFDNGFSYYIRENSKPENRLEMRLVVNAGSILETESQLGLAHFLEHMAFNGTRNFAKNDLIQYLQSIGVEFGPDLNAYTSFDETVYMLTIPSDSANLVDKGFMVMEDWAFYLTLDPIEIDKERGVIIEEWRLGQGPWKRMLDKNLPVIFKDSRYAERLPIGKKEIIESFDHQEIRNFYADWYRPDLMALIVVGDIDADEMESKIKQHFESHPKAVNPKERVEFSVPDQNQTLVSIATDAEAPVSLLRVLYKTNVAPYKTGQDYLNRVKETFLAGMLNRRLMEINEQASPPFINVGYYYGSLWSRNKNALQAYGLVGETGLENGLKVMLEENNRVALHGFTQSEFDRYKLEYLKQMETAFNERDKTESSVLADEYIRNYLESEPIPGIEFEFQFVQQHIGNINLADINQLASEIINSQNRVIVLNGPEKESLALLTDAQILAIATAADKSDLPAYADKLASNSLMEELPKAGSIISEKKIESIGATELTLSNGAVVLLKPTQFKNDEIQVTAFAWGGQSLAEDKDHYSAMHAASIVSETGLSDFSKTDLSKLLAGKNVYAGTSLGTYSQNLSANCSPKDAETMLQLIYLYFTSPRYDENGYQAFINKNRDLFKNLGQEPTNYFYDQFNRLRAQNHPRGNYLPEEGDWDKIDYKTSMDLYKNMFGNAAEFTFIFVGAFNADSLKPLLAQYLGALPVQSGKKTYRDLGIRPPADKLVENVYKGADQKSMTILSFHSEISYNEKDAFLLNQLAQLLNRRYYEILREEMSGVYGVGTNAALNKVPYEYASFSITIPCSPTNVDSLVNAALGELKKIQAQGVEQKDIEKARELYKREKERNLQENSFWLGAIRNCYQFNLSFDQIPSFEPMELITSEELQRVANTYIKADNYLQVVLYPESMKK